jgi:ABC-type polysaccharide/polyol phosphate export permease
MRLHKAILAAAWMGWQREMEWTNPALSLFIKTVAPTAAVLGAAAVYWFGSSFAGLFTADRLAYILVGASLYAQVAAYAYVPTAAISEGKWSNLYPQVYITPTSSIPYLAGRCLASFADSAPVVAISLVVSYYASIVLFGSAPTILLSVNSVLMTTAALLVSLPAAMGLGYIIGSYSIFVSRFEWALPSYVSGLLMIFSEALFPASILPYPLQLIAQALPFTYLMRASRAALIYDSWSTFTLSMGYLALGGLILLVIGVVGFNQAERSARGKGLIDKKVM